MAFRLTDSQEKIVQIVTAALAQKATPQLRFFWRKLRAAALPDMPVRTKKQTVAESALAQTRWQRMAALCADSHVAGAQLLKQEIELELQIEAAKSNPNALTPAESAARLEELVLQAPISVQGKIYKRIQEAHPEWDDEDAW